MLVLAHSPPATALVGEATVTATYEASIIGHSCLGRSKDILIGVVTLLANLDPRA